MISNAYCIISETTEDCLDETESLEEAVRIARSLAREGQVGNPVSIELGAKSSGNWSLCPMARWKKRRLVDEGQKG